MTTRERLSSGDYFENLTFAGLELDGFDLSRREFFRCTFSRSKLQQARWAKARLEDCVFEDCDVTGAQLPQLLAVGVTFRGCKLMGIDWTDVAPNPRLAFEDCNLRYCTFEGTNLRKTRFARCRATDVNFVRADLVESQFDGTDLTGTTFRDCDLRKADFADARGLFFEPPRNRLRDTRVPLETAVAIATWHGLKVTGFADE